MSSQLFKKPIPFLALLLAYIIWGGNFVVAKIALVEFPPMTLAFLRFALASLFIAPFFLIHNKNFKYKKIDKKHLPKLVLVGIFAVTLNITLFFEGMLRTTAINASVLNLTVPILSVLFGWVVLKERIYFVNLIGIFAGLLGALIIIDLPQLFFGDYSLRMLLGNLLIILAGISWVAGGVFAKQMLKIYPSHLVTTIAFLVGTVTFFLPALKEYIDNPAWVNNVTFLGGLGLTYMTLLSSISAYFLYEWGLSNTSVNKANLLQYVEPFIASSLAVAILGEGITPPFIFGALLIGLGVYLGTLAKEPHHKIHKIHRH